MSIKKPNSSNKTAARKEWSSVERKSKDNQEITREEDSQPHVFTTNPAVVKMSLGRTLNAGNYESIRVDVGIELPCYTEEVDAGYKRAKQFCERKMEKLIEELSE